MKRFVGSPAREDVILGALAALFVAIVEVEAISYLLVVGLLAIVIWRDQNRRRREKHGAMPGKPS